MQGLGASVFDGVPEVELAETLAHLPRRRYTAGETLIEEGETRPRELFIVESGTADVLIADARGTEHFINRATRGGTLGEMALFTGEPAAATVRAATELRVLVVTEASSTAWRRSSRAST